MWDLIVSVPDHCLSFYFSNEGVLLMKIALHIFKKLFFRNCDKC